MRTLSATSALRLGSLAFCAALVAGCASAPPKAERYVAPPVGASWKVQVSSTGSFGNVSKLEQQVSMRDVVVEGKPYLRLPLKTGVHSPIVRRQISAAPPTSVARSASG